MNSIESTLTERRIATQPKAEQLPLWTAGVRAFLERLVRPEDRMLVAVSAGADSVGLLCLLTDALSISSERLDVLHVDHGIRGDTGEDEALVQDLCAERHVPCHVVKVDALEFARRHRLSLEVAARRLRYSALWDVAADLNCKWILTGHTRDDSAETVLMRMLSGAPWCEWTGIPARRGAILRPLICVSRTEIRDWVWSRGLPFREDVTNADPRFARNRLRSVLVKHGNVWSSHRTAALANAGAELEEALRATRLAARVWCGRTTEWVSKGGICLETDEIFRYFSSLTFMPVEVAWAHLSGRAEARLPSAMRRQIADCLRGGSPRATIALGDEIELVRHGNRVCVCRKLKPLFSRVLAVGRNEVQERRGIVELRLSSTSEKLAGDAVAARADLLQRNLHLRIWQPGDRMRLPGRPTKKVTDLLAEHGVHPALRAHALIVADDDGPLWIVGGPLDARAQAPSDARETLILSWIPRDGCC